MINNSDVSILIPAYCTSLESVKWLEECVISALSQGCEVVLYNDGSSQSIKAIKELNKVHIYVESDVNKGVSYARNRAAHYATKPYIFPLDCDDILVDGAINELLSAYDGTTPVYSDVEKFGDENILHYRVLDFTCNNILSYVGFSSVNVLHTKEQWKEIGGWDESLEFYEDGYYNAQLFAKWCGKRYPKPLIRYRIHKNQRTKQYKSVSSNYARFILDKIRSLDMPCPSCGGKRSLGTSGTASRRLSVPASKIQTIEQLPGEDSDGRVLAQYVGGKGKGKHYYRGVATKFAYKVIHGDYVYADPKDVKLEGSTGQSLLIKVARPEPAQPTEVVKRVVSPPDPTKNADRAPKKSMDKSPVIDVPDIANMSLKEIRNLDVDGTMASKLLGIEKNGKNRSSVISHFKGMLK